MACVKKGTNIFEIVFHTFAIFFFCNFGIVYLLPTKVNLFHIHEITIVGIRIRKFEIYYMIANIQRLVFKPRPMFDYSATVFAHEHRHRRDSPNGKYNYRKLYDMVTCLTISYQTQKLRSVFNFNLRAIMINRLKF